MRLLSQMHSSFRGVSGSLSARSSSSFYLLAPPVPLHLFLSLSSASPGFCRTPGLLLYTTRANIAAVLTLALIRALRLSPLSSSTSLRARNAAVILVRFWYSRPPLCFPQLFFLHHHIVARPFSGSGTNGRVSGPPCKVGSPCFFITLVTGVVTLFGTPSFRT